MTTKIGINGFGRIGRLVLRGALNNPQAEIVGMYGGHPTPARTLAPPGLAALIPGAAL